MHVTMRNPSAIALKDVEKLGEISVITPPKILIKLCVHFKITQDLWILVNENIFILIKLYLQKIICICNYFNF